MLKPVLRWILVLGGSVAYLGLAAAGLGSIAPFHRDPALAAFVVSYLAITVIALFAGGNISPGVKEDRGNRWVLAAFGILGLLLGFVPALTDRLGVWCLDGEATRWVGVVVFLAGGLLRMYPVYVLGDRFSGLVAIQRGHTLVTTGIYGVIRHPSYLGAVLYSAGWSLAFRSVAGLILTAAMMVPMLARIRAEERLLADQFGAEYEAYRGRTARMIPGFW